MYCPNCKKTIPENSAFCPECGAQTTHAATPPYMGNTAAPPVYSSQQYHQPQQQGFVQQVPVKKKKHKALKVLLVLVGVIGVIALSLYAFLPGLLRPYDLGVKTSKEAYQSAVQKMKYLKDDSPTKGSVSDYTYQYGPLQAVDTTMTSEEVTSFFNYNRPSYYPLKDVQIKINADNTVEASATVDTNYVFDEMLKGKYTKADLQQAVPALGLVPEHVNVYCKFSGGMSNNQISGLQIGNLSVMGISVPENIVGYGDAAGYIVETVNGFLQQSLAKSGTVISQLGVSGGKLVVKGNFPSSLTRVPLS